MTPTRISTFWKSSYVIGAAAPASAPMASLFHASFARGKVKAWSPPWPHLATPDRPKQKAAHRSPGGRPSIDLGSKGEPEARLLLRGLGEGGLHFVEAVRDALRNDV